jgi:ankyrin repeat protein
MAKALKSVIVWGLLLSNGCRSNNNNLLDAIKQKDVEAVRRMLAAGVELEPASGPYDVIKPLAYAAAYGNLEIVKLLVKAGADLNGHVAYGDVPLMMADEHGNDDITTYLIEQGADVNAPNDFGMTLFIGLCQRGRIKLVQLATKHGGDVNSSFIARTGEGTGMHNYSPLQAAVANGRLEVVKLLLSLGANPEAKDYKGRTSIEIAEFYHRAEVANLLRQQLKPVKKD